MVFLVRYNVCEASALLGQTKVMFWAQGWIFVFRWCAFRVIVWTLIAVWLNYPGMYLFVWSGMMLSPMNIFSFKEVFAFFSIYNQYLHSVFNRDSHYTRTPCTSRTPLLIVSATWKESIVLVWGLSLWSIIGGIACAQTKLQYCVGSFSPKFNACLPWPQLTL